MKSTFIGILAASLLPALPMAMAQELSPPSGGQNSAPGERGGRGGRQRPEAGNPNGRGERGPGAERGRGGERGGPERGGPGGERGRGGFGGGDFGVFGLRGLDLSEDQTQAIQGLREQFRDATRSVTETVNTERQKLQELIRNGASEGEIRAQSLIVDQAAVELAIASANLVREIRSTLTPEQVGKLSDMQENARQRMEEFRERMENARREGGGNRPQQNQGRGQRPERGGRGPEATR